MQLFALYKTNWYGRPNPEGRIIRKFEGQITDEMAEKLEKWKAKFYLKAE